MLIIILDTLLFIHIVQIKVAEAFLHDRYKAKALSHRMLSIGIIS